MFTKLGSYALIPAQIIAKREKNDFARGRKRLEGNFGGKEISIVAQDGIKLNGMLFRKSRRFFNRNRKLLIRFGGNGENYESHGLWGSYVENAHKVGVDVLLHNYRGVGKSEGSPTQEHLTKDGGAVIDFAIKEGYNPKNILVHGHSLGGAVATKALASKPEKYRDIKFINDRSFSSVKKVIKNYSRMNFIFKYFLIFLLHLSRWNIDVREDWKKIKGQKLILYSDSDEMIPYKGSLVHAIREENGTDASRVLPLKGAYHCSQLSVNNLKVITTSFDGSKVSLSHYLNPSYQKVKAFFNRK